MIIRKKKKAFSLTELLVVLAVIGILVAMVLPNALDTIEKANIASCANNVRTLNSSAQMCFLDMRQWASCDDSSEVTPFLEGGVWPTCPFGTTIYSLAGSITAGYGITTNTHFATFPPAAGDNHN